MRDKYRERLVRSRDITLQNICTWHPSWVSHLPVTEKKKPNDIGTA